MTNKFPEMPFWDHLEELRWRLITSIVVILIGAGITYKFSDTIMLWLIIPTESLDIDLNLQVLKITSMFTVKLSVALFGGITLGLPVLLFQFWRFVSPAFEDKHGFAVLLTVLFSSGFFVLGMCFAYFVIIPFSLAFFTSLTSESVDVAYNFTLEGYLTYILWLVFGCGLLFSASSDFYIFYQDRHPNAFILRSIEICHCFISHTRSSADTSGSCQSILIVIPLILLYEFSILISKLIKPKDSLV